MMRPLWLEVTGMEHIYCRLRILQHGSPAYELPGQAGQVVECRLFYRGGRPPIGEVSPKAD